MANTLKFGNGQWATGNGTALAYNDENSNFKPLPFDFTRASSGTVVNQSGLIETVGSGIPRIDFLGNTEGALLLEASRTNLITYSVDFSNSSWNKGTGTITSNASISPDGTLNGSRYNVVGTSSFAYLSQTVSANASQNYTYSIWVKKVSGSGILKLAISDVSLATRASENINLTNEFVRYSFTIASGDLSNTGYIGAGFINVTNGDIIEVYGAQLEQGSYATSYIPTSGIAVTRAADNPFQREDLASKNLIGNTEFTWFYDCILFIKEGGTTVAPKLINSSNNQIFIGVNIPVTGSNDLRIRHKDGSSASNTSSIPFTSGDRYKIAVKISGTTGSAYINGTNLGTFTTAAAINYNKYSNAANNPNNIIDMRIYNTALTDAELVALTTI